MQQPVVLRKTSRVAESRRRETRLVLFFSLLGAGTAAVLRPQPVIIGIVLGLVAAALLYLAFRALRRASRKIDDILAAELTSAQPQPTVLRKTA
jgi:threonine/homoserine/homoserine lactone efflux protein